MSHNKISILELTNLTRLNELDLSQNGINDDLFQFIKVPNNLKILYINDNKITFKQKETQLKGLNFLVKLSLANNLIENLLSKQFPESLSHLNLENNRITHLDKFAFNNLKQLKELNLKNNQLANVDIEMTHKNIPKPLKIELSRNILNKFPIIRNVFSLDLDLSGNKRLTELTRSRKIDDMMKHIVNLDLSNCGLNLIDEDFFSYAYKLINLNLAQNKLANLGDELNSPTISLLNLSDNKIESIQSVTIGNITKSNDKELTIVLKNNKISSVPKINFPNTLDTFKLELDMSNMNHFSFSAFLDSLMGLNSLKLEISKIDLSFNNINEIENAHTCSSYSLDFKLIELIIYSNPYISEEILCLLYTRTQRVDKKEIRLKLNPMDINCNLINSNHYNTFDFSDSSNCSQNEDKHKSCESILLNNCFENEWTESEIVTSLFLSFQCTLILTSFVRVIYICNRKPKFKKKHQIE